VDEPEGGYRIVFFHDKNGNGQFDATLAHVAVRFELQKLVIHEVKVAMHADLPVPAAYVYRDVWVNAILQNMSLRLQRRDTLKDVRCPVEFKLSGNVSTFTSTGGLTLTPDTPVATKAIYKKFADYNFVMVKQDVSCDGGTGNWGCTRKGKPPSIVVVHAGGTALSVSTNGFNWLHEFGHQKGINYEAQDTYAKGDETNDRLQWVMYQNMSDMIPPDGSAITKDEAKKFRQK
jgi:hypothetical protein